MVVFEELLDQVGGAGKYQYLQCLPLVLVLPAMSWHLLGNSFMFATPEKRCDIQSNLPPGCQELIGPNATGYNIGEYDQILRYSLFTDVSNKPKAYCRVRSLPNDFCDNLPKATQLWNETKPDYWADNNVLNMETRNQLDAKISKISTETTKECAKFHYSPEFYGSTGVTELNWVCAHDKNVENLQIAVMVGVFWGSPLFGWTSDNFGRKLTLCFCFSLSFVSMLLVRFVSGAMTFPILCVLRMLDGAGAIGGIAAAFVLISEVFESKGIAKILVLQIGQSLFGVGQAALAWIMASYRDWRILSIIMAMPMLMVIVIWMFNDESARWLITKNRFDEANRILKRMAKQNGKQVEKTYVFREEVKDNDDDEKPSESIMAGLKKPRMRRIIINLCYQWFMLSGIYYALAVKAATFGRNPFVSYTISGFLEVPACFGTLLMYQFLGRRPSTFFLECFAGITLVMIMFTPAENTALMSTLPQLGKFFLTAVYGGIYVYTAEIFPTTIKNSGIGICSSIARIGGVASQIIEMIPKMCSEDSSIDCTKVPYAIYGVLTIVGCVLMFGLPETKDETSPDNIEDGESFGKDQSGLLVQITRLCSKETKRYEVDDSEERKMLDEHNANNIQESSVGNSRLESYKDLPETNL